MSDTVFEIRLTDDGESVTVAVRANPPVAEFELGDELPHTHMLGAMILDFVEKEFPPNGE